MGIRCVYALSMTCLALMLRSTSSLSEYSISQNKGRSMDVVTNSFCAGGVVLGNGTWLNVGGNQAVKAGGDTADSQNGGGVYNDPDGGNSYVDESFPLDHAGYKCSTFLFFSVESGEHKRSTRIMPSQCFDREMS